MNPVGQLLDTLSHMQTHLQSTGSGIGAALGPSASTRKAPADPFAQMKKLYPALAAYADRVAYRAHPGGRSKYGNTLEFWGRGEQDSFDPSRPALEVYGRNVKARDIAGDIVSHYLARGVDPTLTSYYNRFVKSLTPDQRSLLRQRYSQEGASQPYAQWERRSGIPAFFRGYAFKQLQANETHYTAQQIQMFNRMNAYLRGQ